MAKKLRSLRCPTCRTIVLKDDPQAPFCSERCRTIDLGKWASGGYVISSPINDPEAIAEVEEFRERRSRERAENDEKDDGSERPN